MLCNCINLNYIGIIKSFFLNHHLVLYILLVIDIITFYFFRSEDDFRKVESSSTVIQSNVFTAYYSQSNCYRTLFHKIYIMFMKVYLNFEYIISSYRGFLRIFDVKNLIHGNNK